MYTYTNCDDSPLVSLCSLLPHDAHRQPMLELTSSPIANPETPTSPTSSAARASTPALSASPPSVPRSSASRICPLAAPFIPLVKDLAPTQSYHDSLKDTA